MRTLKLMILASTFAASSMLGAEPQLSATTCAQLAETRQLTDEAKARFAQLVGSCQGVYEINGAQYVLVKAEYRGKQDGQTVLYLPATDRTVQLTPRPEARVIVDGRKVKPSALSRGDEVSIYLSVDKFTQDREVQEVTFAAEETTEPVITEPVVEPVAAEPVQVAAALPVTASPLPLVALLSAASLAVGALLRRSARKA
jgi:hypothetical protein